MNNFQILKINKNAIKNIEELFKLNGEIMILTKNSDKPLVFHKQTNQMSFVISGNGIVYLNNEKFEVKNGDLIIIPIMTKHSFVAISNEFKLGYIHWPLDYIKEDRFIDKNDVQA